MVNLRYARLTTLGAVVALLAVASVETASAESTLEKVREQGYVEIGIGEGFPYAGLSPEGEAIGAAPELAAAVLRQMGIPEVRPNLVDWGALIPGLLASRFDIVTTGMFMNPERCEAVLFSQPDTCSLEGFMVAKGNPLGITTYADVAANPDVMIGFTAGSFQEQLARDAGVDPARFVTAPDTQSRFKLLQTGRIQVWADPSDTLFSLQNPDPNFEVVFVEDLPPSCAGAAFRPEDQDFRDAYDAALKELQASGEFDAILTKYGFPAEAAREATREQLCGQPN